jgi:hypothetical protein
VRGPAVWIEKGVLGPTGLVVGCVDHGSVAVLIQQICEIVLLVYHIQLCSIKHGIADWDVDLLPCDVLVPC